ncbi:MAG: hypothetical protein HN509_06645 [Halobacteriovoraceae bacterium]|jgi:hypothetical protein|nr:hypothetical protein [Halobacteriovoraceae bacterium]MBT5095954.1 hypothetical protein [Halobacteriovoraceae bacterium]
MNSYTLKEVTNKKELAAMIDLPWKLYANDPNWVPPLKMAVHDLFKPKHPFYETSELKSWMAEDAEGNICGRIIAVVNDHYNKFHEQKIGFFGFFEAENNSFLAKTLFDAAEGWLKDKGMTSVLGPMNPSTNYECGTLVEGFEDPPQIMMTYNPEYHKDLIEGCGYAKAKDLIAYNIEIEKALPDSFKRITERIERSKKISYRTANKKDWQKEVDLMLEVYNDAWEKNWGFVPMTEAEFRHTANDLKQVVDENLIIFAEIDGDTAGFVVGLPDLNQVFKKIPSGKLLPFGIFKLLNYKKHVDRMRVPTMGVKRKYHKLGLAALLLTRIQEAAHRDPNYHFCEASWILEDNLNMNKPLIKMGGIPYKTYRIFEKNL